LIKRRFLDGKSTGNNQKAKGKTKEALRAEFLGEVKRIFGIYPEVLFDVSIVRTILRRSVCFPLMP
jgi:hypothetical protein